jgi:hypothetical protein
LRRPSRSPASRRVVRTSFLCKVCHIVYCALRRLIVLRWIPWTYIWRNGRDQEQDRLFPRCCTAYGESRFTLITPGPNAPDSRAYFPFLSHSGTNNGVCRPQTSTHLLPNRFTNWSYYLLSNQLRRTLLPFWLSQFWGKADMFLPLQHFCAD